MKSSTKDWFIDNVNQSTNYLCALETIGLLEGIENTSAKILVAKSFKYASIQIIYGPYEYSDKFVQLLFPTIRRIMLKSTKKINLPKTIQTLIRKFQKSYESDFLKSVIEIGYESDIDIEAEFVKIFTENYNI